MIREVSLTNLYPVIKLLIFMASKFGDFKTGGLFAYFNFAGFLKL